MSLKILLADDSLTAQNMGKKILTEAGYEVIAVSNGAQAIKKIVSDRPDLVVLDVYMPGYSGVELCERMRNTRETAKTPVVLSVGKMEAFKPEEVTRIRADGLIIKPFEATELLAVVKKLALKVTPASPKKPAEVQLQDPIEEVDETDAGPTPTVEVPEEIAATPVIGMELISEDAELPPTTMEFEVERQPEPAPAYDGPRMVSADGLSGVFEVEPSSQQPAPEPAAEPAPPAESERSAEPASVPPEVPAEQIHAAPTAEPSATVEYDFTAVPSSEIAGEAAFTPESSAEVTPELTSAPLPGSETTLQEEGQAAVQARETPQQPAPVTARNEIDANPASAVHSEIAAPVVSDAALAELERELGPELAGWGDMPEVHHREDGQVEWDNPRPIAPPVWVAEETQVAPDESALTLHEEMQRAAASLSHSAEPTQGPALAAQDSAAVESDPALSYYQPEEHPQPVQTATTDYAAEVAPEAAPRMSTPMITVAPTDPARIAAIVDQVLERLKPELIAAVTLELEKKNNQ